MQTQTRYLKPRIHVIDFSPIYEKGGIQHSVYELARIIMYMYNAGKILLASSPDVGDYYIDPVFSQYLERARELFYKYDTQKEMASEEKKLVEQHTSPDELAITLYSMDTGHKNFIQIFDGYETALIDLDEQEIIRSDIVKTWRSGNSVVIALPVKQNTYFRRVFVSDNMILLDSIT